VKSSILGKQKKWNTSTNIFWGVSRVLYLSGILGYLFIIENFVMLSGTPLRGVLSPNLAVGKVIFSHTGIA
jgi:hypothetical protein